MYEDLLGVEEDVNGSAGPSPSGGNGNGNGMNGGGKGKKQVTKTRPRVVGAFDHPILPMPPVSTLLSLSLFRIWV